jgi:hypothetical protein
MGHEGGLQVFSVANRVKVSIDHGSQEYSLCIQASQHVAEHIDSKCDAC